MSTVGLAVHPHQCHQVSRATIPRTPSQGESRREKQLQSWVSSSGSEVNGASAPLLTLAAEQVTESSSLAHHEELRV